jgi:hypothetical protein
MKICDVPKTQYNALLPFKGMPAQEKSAFSSSRLLNKADSFILSTRKEKEVAVATGLAALVAGVVASLTKLK